jgi:hypothetical protein
VSVKLVLLKVTFGASAITETVAVMEVEPPVLRAVMTSVRWGRVSVGVPLIIPVEGFKCRPIGSSDLFDPLAHRLLPWQTHPT